MKAKENDGRRTLRSIKSCGFTYEVADLLVRKLKKMSQYANCDIQRLGPSGMKAESSVSVKDGDRLIGFLTIRYGYNGAFEYVDYNRKISSLNSYATKVLPTKLEDAIKLVLSKGQDIPAHTVRKGRESSKEISTSDLFSMFLPECEVKAI